MTMARPAVQEEVSMGRVTEAVVPVQGFQAIKLDTSIKDTKATREVTTSRGSAAAAVGLSEQSQTAEHRAISCLHY